MPNLDDFNMDENLIHAVDSRYVPIPELNELRPPKITGFNFQPPPSPQKITAFLVPKIYVILVLQLGQAVFSIKENNLNLYSKKRIMKLSSQKLSNSMSGNLFLGK